MGTPGQYQETVVKIWHKYLTLAFKTLKNDPKKNIHAY